MKPDDGISADYYHSLHSCGHAVWWNDPGFAAVTANYPCPWCGGQTGKASAPTSYNQIDDDRTGLRGFRQLDPDGSVPRFPGETSNREVILRHRADNRCCRYARPLPAPHHDA